MRPTFSIALGTSLLALAILAGCGPVYLSGEPPDTSYADSYGPIYGGFYGGYYGTVGWYDPYYNRPYCYSCGSPDRPPAHRPPDDRPPAARPPEGRPPVARPMPSRPPSLPSRPRPRHR